jgi:YidC/Oxa1 family membrane protein insertase
MDNKRFLLALALSALVILLVQVIFPAPKRVQGANGTTPVTDSVARQSGASSASGGGTTAAAVAGTTPGAAPSASAAAAPDSSGAAGTAAAGAPRVVAVPTGKAVYRMSSVGAAPVSAEIVDYRPLAKGGRATDAHIELARPGEPLLRYRLVVPGDTIALDRTNFTLTDSTAAAGRGGPLTYEAVVPTRSGQSARVALTYTFPHDSSYLMRVNGTVTGVAGQGFVLIDLPQGLRSQEADTLDDQRHLAFALKPARDNAKSIGFDKLDPGERRIEQGPFTWAVTKNKYFLVGLLVPEGNQSIAQVDLTGGPRTSKVASNARATVVQRLDNSGKFGFELYAGPQEYRRLHALGRDFENANPHGGFLQGVLQPISTIVIRVLLWMHETLKLSYGWVLVVFAVVVRLALWPLNQNAMRSSLKMQQLQPRLQEVQERYRDDPQKLQQEMMKVYRENGMSPLSPLLGCLPMLIPMPILLTLIFVFQNTIEFRGVSFLWLHDMSAKDPYYIAPLLMGLTTYLLSWIGMRNAPPNPQAKMMTYMMPVMMTVFLVNLAGGLNLYYVVQNLAALPQQWLIANERSKAQVKPVVSGPPAQKRKTPAKGLGREGKRA